MNNKNKHQMLRKAIAYFIIPFFIGIFASLLIKYFYPSINEVLRYMIFGLMGGIYGYFFAEMVYKNI